MLRFKIVNKTGRPVPRRFLETWVKKMGRELSRLPRIERLLKGRELTVAFVPSKEARELNRRFRRRDYATDVLSFAPLEPDSLGELVICPKVISRQAREHGLLVREELGYMVLHGVLHLLGFDHEGSKAEAERMFAIQDRVFERLLGSVKRQS